MPRPARLVGVSVGRAARAAAALRAPPIARKPSPAQGEAPAESSGLRVEVRKIVSMLEEIHHEGGPRAARPQRRGAIAAVIANPFAGRYVEDIAPMMEALKPLSLALARQLIKALGGAARIESYGKGGIIGTGGESEHGALWHVPGGYGMRELLDNSKAIVPSNFKVAAPGTVIDIPLHHRTAAFVRSHFDTIEMRVADAPRADEIVFILAMATGPRVHQRMGGMRAGEISKFDGQR